MKKLLSLALVAVMLFACAAAAFPASAEHEIYAENIDAVEAKYFDVKPFVDGFVSEAEWGAPVVEVTQDNAAQTGDTAPKNSSYFHCENTYDATTLKMSYKLWFGWDENNLYVAAVVSDPDGHSLKRGRNFTYNGDAFQMKIDPDGPNAACNGFTFHAEDQAAHKYEPWGSDSISDMQFGYTEMANGFNEAWLITGDDDAGRGMTAESHNPLGAVNMAISPAGYNYTTDTANGKTTYEIAIPWAFVESGGYVNAGHAYKESDWSGEPDDGAIGREYGVSTVVYNADGASEADILNAGLAWGSGIYNYQTNHDRKTAGGSNALLLIEDKLSADSLYNSGYTKYTEGGYVAPDVVPNYDMDIDQSYYTKLTYDSEADLDIFGAPDIVNAERVQLDDGNWVLKWDKATQYDIDRAAATEGREDVPTLNEQNYIASDGYEGEGNRFTIKNQSFTFEFDIMVTGMEVFEQKYPVALYNWFGGANTVGFECGYYFDDGKFELRDSDGDFALAETPADFSLNEWHHWVFQYENSTCTARFYLDPKMENGRVATDAVPIFNLSYRYFDYGSAVNPLQILRRFNAQILLDNVEVYNFVDFTKTNHGGAVIDPGTGSGGGGTTGPVDKTEDVDVDVTVEQLADGSFALSVPNSDKYKDNSVTALTFTVEYDTSKLTFKGVDGIDEAALEVSDDGNGKATIKVVSFDAVKAAEGTLFRVIVAPNDGVTLTADEVASLVKVTASITTRSGATGDTIVAVVAAVVTVTILGSGVVLYRRKRNHVDF